MYDKSNYAFRIKVDKIAVDCWSIGSCFSHSFGETYLFINFFKWSISIGWLFKESEDEE